MGELEIVTTWEKQAPLSQDVDDTTSQRAFLSSPFSHEMVVISESFSHAQDLLTQHPCYGS